MHKRLKYFLLDIPFAFGKRMGNVVFDTRYVQTQAVKTKNLSKWMSSSWLMYHFTEAAAQPAFSLDGTGTAIGVDTGALCAMDYIDIGKTQWAKQVKCFTSVVSE